MTVAVNLSPFERLEALVKKARATLDEAKYARLRAETKAAETDNLRIVYRDGYHSVPPELAHHAERAKAAVLADATAAARKERDRTMLQAAKAVRAIRAELVEAVIQAAADLMAEAARIEEDVVTQRIKEARG